ncbi:PfkB family carbohydrate kinase [Mixta mediterraneensis]|uniref:PfkB family carbohydrate kinase n=1 Tax=Mixta mediterraneensis TaxID=2758443 RepID=UPI0018769543|nr:PfkB family carbohydrate kinase [Mixta mediterraneensis]MBE5253853.1 bifunctional hydroxymethylpyrimidine kinase/phosphomethylpyrimidine kinase [Mixta mediterraneensis]
MNKIAVTDSLHYDIMLDAHHRPEKGETVMGTACKYKFGGKGGNQAISAALAGASVVFAGAVGADEQGKFLLNKLQNAGVNTDAIAVIDNIPSGMSVAITDAEGNYGAVVVSNANQHIAQETFIDEAFWRDVTLLILQNEVSEVVNLQAAAEAKKRGVTVCINAAPARPLSPELEAHIDVLVVNAIEARDMSHIAVNGLTSAKRAAEALAQRFPQVVVTAGEYGVAYCQTGQASHSLPAKKVELISTHGAGDCFTGVLCTALNKHNNLADAVAQANEAAAKHVSHKLN